ncbi:hypothetical protein ABZY90_00795 [Streptomyces sp. NPDC006422]|uniref:hypothetical protein n=1 Tax=unclassified Streptomyces TaxID=2593676 RepID=UPI0033A9CC7E
MANRPGNGSGYGSGSGSGSSDREIDDSELMDVAQDPEQAHSLHKALRTLARNPNVHGPLQEMAQGILSGRIGMTDAIKDERYMGALGDRMTEIRHAAESQTMQDREAERGKREEWERKREEEAQKEREERDGPSTNLFTGSKKRGQGGGHRG